MGGKDLNLEYFGRKVLLTSYKYAPAFLSSRIYLQPSEKRVEIFWIV